MDTKPVLRELGLSDGEITVYLALLKLGSSPANAIKKETGLHRTTIYDFVEKLINKGLVHYVIKNEVSCYNATDPKKLMDILNEKQEHLQTVLPDLIKLRAFQKEEVSVEVYRGKEAFKTICNDILRVGKDFVAMGIDENKFNKEVGTILEQFFVKEKKAGIKERMITSEDATLLYDTPSYRFVPKEFFNPTPTFIWGDNVGIIMWDPFTIIKISNLTIADSYSKYFEMLWSMAKEKPKPTSIR